MREQHIAYVQKHKDIILEHTQQYLTSKGLTIEDYLGFIQTSNNKADEITLYLLARQYGLHVAVITHDRVFYTHTILASEADPSDWKIVLAYLGQGMVRDTKI